MAEKTRLYRVYLTPRTGQRTYGDEIEITDRVRAAKVGKIVRSIDSQDFAIGVYSINSVKIDCDNSDGYFGDDSRSVFKFSRDLAKIRIVWEKRTQPEYEGENYTIEATTRFKGLIDDEDSRLDPIADTIRLQVVSLDSVIRKSKVSRDALSDRNTYSQALITILSTEDITSVLTFDADKVTVSYDGRIDDASKFDEKPKKKALDELLGVSNSYLFIDDNDTILIKSRAHSTTKAPLKLFGPNDPLGRENIIYLRNYNTGLHRTFNSITVNNSTRSDESSISEYLFRQRKYEFSWMTNDSEAEAAAGALLAEFRYPKIELEVELETKLIQGYDLLDRVIIDYPLRSYVPAGRFLPIVGQSIVGDPLSPVAEVSGSVRIPPSKIFKIIKISEDEKTFTSVLKLREVGTGVSDGVDDGEFFVTLSASFATQTEADYGDGETNETVGGVAAISDEALFMSASGDFVDFNGNENASKLTQNGAIEIDFKPDYSGSPASDNPIVSIFKATNQNENEISIAHTSAGNLVATIRDKSGTSIVSLSGAWSPTAGVTYRIALQFDVGIGESQMFVDGSQFGSTQTGTGTRDDNIGVIRLGRYYDETGVPGGYYSNLKLFKTVIHTADYEVA